MASDDYPFESSGRANAEFDELAVQYPGLETSQVLIKVFAGLIIAAGAVMAFFTAYTGLNSPFKNTLWILVMATMQFGLAVVCAVFYYAFAGLIGLAIDVPRDLKGVRHETRRLHNDVANLKYSNQPPQHS